MTQTGTTNYQTTCALLDSGEVKCWGYNATTGLTGVGTTESTVAIPQKVRTGLQADSGPFLQNVNQLFGGYAGFCAVTESSELYCWGNNFATFAQLQTPAKPVATVGYVDQGSLTYLSEDGGFYSKAAATHTLRGTFCYDLD
jgi:hypothetical protein